jgi:hypothetical protein
MIYPAGSSGGFEAMRVAGIPMDMLGILWGLSSQNRSRDVACNAPALYAVVLPILLDGGCNLWYNPEYG